MIIDKLYAAVKEKGHVCVGLDTSLEYVPVWFRDKFTSIEDALFQFNKSIVDATCDTAACFKIQIAYYEALGIQGLMAYKRTLKYVRSLGAVAIADIKRGDIAKTAEMYAKAHFEGDFESDFITLNPYMGMDSLNPYMDYVKNREKGLFVLVRTSNEGARDIQYIEDKNRTRVYTRVAEKLHDVSMVYLGNCGYSSVGGVFGCTHIDEAARLRQELNHMFMLIPGYGAQGGGASDVAAYLKDGNGGIVNSSRSILLAYKNFEDGEHHFDLYARNECLKMKEEILHAAGLSKK